MLTDDVLSTVKIDAHYPRVIPLQVLESTERSAFSATNNWGGAAERDSRLSQDTGGGGVDGLESLSHDELLAECRRARAELAASREAEGKAAESLSRVMEANKTLQLQLKDLNGVVEAIVTAELGGVPRPKGKAGPPSVFPGKAGPPSVFPGKAKPGKK